MKHYITSAVLSGLFISAHIASGQYIWTNNGSSGTPKPWEDPGNWDTNGVPNNPATQEVRFDGTSGAIYTVQLNSDKTLEAGMLVVAGTSTTPHITMDLNENSLIFSGGSLIMNPRSTGNTASRTLLTFRNGVVQLGTGSTGATASSLVLGLDGDAIAGSVTDTIRMVFDDGSTLNTANTSHIHVASSDNTRLQNITLDLSEANLVSGTQEKTLAVTGNIAIGERTNTAAASNRNRYGTLRLGVLEHLQVGGSLIVGQSARTNNVATTENRGELHLSTSEDQETMNMSIGDDLRIGVGASSEGTIHTPDTLNIAIGSETTRGGAIYTGYKHVTTSTAQGNAEGTFVTKGGNISAYITELRVGQNNHATDGTATGTLDFSASDLDILNISGDAVIGQGLGGVGVLKLKGGEASSSNLVVGNSTGVSTDSVLELQGTTWSVTNTLHVGATGDITITLGENSIGGIDLLSSTASDFTIATGGSITVIFGEQTASETIWGVRMAGDQLSLFEQYLEDDLFIGAGTYGSQASVFKDEEFTYFGVIPEPSTGALLLLSLLGIRATRKRQ